MVYKLLRDNSFAEFTWSCSGEYDQSQMILTVNCVGNFNPTSIVCTLDGDPYDCELLLGYMYVKTMYVYERDSCNVTA